MFIMDEIRENTAGAIMTPEFVRLRAGTRTGEAIRAVRASGLDSDALYTIYVVDGADRLLGVLELRALLFAPEEATLETLMDTAFQSVNAMDDQQHAAALVRKYDLLSLPVTDDEGRLVGAIGVGSIVDVIEEEDTEDFERMAALVPAEDGYATASTFALAKRRLPWLLILMAASVLCERLNQSYEGFLRSSEALGVLMVSCMPMLMDTGGNAGSQSSTTVIRAMALGELSPRDTPSMLWKELRTSLLCGLGLALVNFVRLVCFAGAAPMAAMSISTAVLLAVVSASVLGGLLPMVARALKLDPALMAGPLLTTIVDVLSLAILFALVSSMA